MINIDFTNIDNAKLTGKLLPYWARGRKISLFMQAILKPITSIHESFKAWALEKYIECHITAQKASLEWYLKYKLQSRFKNHEATFYIAQGANGTLSCFGGTLWRNKLLWANSHLWAADSDDACLTENFSCFSVGEWDNQMRWNNSLYWENDGGVQAYEKDALDISDSTCIYAPEIIDTINYDHSDYERDIRGILSKYMINFDRMEIIIADN